MAVGKLIAVLLGVLAFLIVVVLILAKVFFGGLSPVTLEYWGLWEPESVMNVAITDYERLHPNIKINYKKQSPIQYRDRLALLLAGNSSPDIFRFHNSWLPMLKDDLSPVPGSAYTTTAFQSTFYPVAQKDLYLNGRYYGIPLEVDTLLLYINNDIFTERGMVAPLLWQPDFIDAAKNLKVENGDLLIRGGAALGNAGNVTHWQDILALISLQNRADFGKYTDSSAKNALGFYTDFEKVDKVWDQSQDESKMAFARGNLAMFFGYSWDYFDIVEMAKNRNTPLNFKVVPVPQLPGGNVNYASYWVEGVAKRSPHQQEAWEFLKFLSSKEELAKLYEAETKLRGFGEPYGRVDMAGLVADQPVVSVVLNQAKTAQSWYLDSLTWDGDTGINSRIGNYFADAVNSLLHGGQIESALDTVSQGIGQVLTSYGVTPAAAR